MSGRLFGVGLGPGDPELITLKAARLVREADVVAYHAGRHGSSIARTIAADLIRPDVVEEQLVYPVTTGITEHPGGYAGAMADFYEESAARLAEHLQQGRDVVLLAEGDPLFYGSYMYMHDRLADRFADHLKPIPSAAPAPVTRATRSVSLYPASSSADSSATLTVADSLMGASSGSSRSRWCRSSDLRACPIEAQPRASG